MLWMGTLLTLCPLYYSWWNHLQSWLFVGAESLSKICWFLTPAEVVARWWPNLPGNSGSWGTPELSTSIIEAEPFGGPSQATTKNFWGINNHKHQHLLLQSQTNLQPLLPTATGFVALWLCQSKHNQLSPKREGTNSTPQMDHIP